MEDMGTVFVDVDAFDVLAIDITAQVWAFVYDQAPLASLFGLVGECGTKETRAND